MLATKTPEFSFARRNRSSNSSAYEVTGGDYSYKSLGALPNAPTPQTSVLTVSDYEVHDRLHSSNDISASDRGPQQAAKSDAVLKGSVHGISSDFLHCVMEVKTGSVEIDVPLQICPTEVQFEGVAIEISIGSEGGYRSLEVRRVGGDPPPPEVTKVVADVLDWVSSI